MVSKNKLPPLLNADQINRYSQRSAQIAQKQQETFKNRGKSAARTHPTQKPEHTLLRDPDPADEAEDDGGGRPRQGRRPSASEVARDKRIGNAWNTAVGADIKASQADRDYTKYEKALKNKKKPPTKGELKTLDRKGKKRSSAAAKKVAADKKLRAAQSNCC